MVKYKQIAIQILKKINHNDYSEKLPSEAELTKQFNASRNTIRKALKLLNDQGIVISIQGSGSYIRSSLNQKQTIMNLSNKLGFQSLNFKKLNSKVINFKNIKANHCLCKYLNCNTNDTIYFIGRLRYAGCSLICLEYSYYLRKYVPYLSKEICQNSIFKFIKDNYNLSVTSSEEFITLHHLTKTEKQLTGKSTNAVIQLEEINMLTNNTPFNYSKTLYFDHDLSFYCYINNRL